METQDNLPCYSSARASDVSAIKDQAEKILRRKINKVIPLADGGSERSFYRIAADAERGRAFVLVSYTNEKEENGFYRDIAEFLKKLRIRVPEIYGGEDGCLIIEDMGDTHLCDLANNPDTKDVSRQYYRKVIEQISVLHQKGKDLYQKQPFKISKGFDYSLYRWESRYFLDNFARVYCGTEIDDNALEKDFHFLAETLSNREMVLVHRDFQSKNIMIKDNEPRIIDFQGMRYGLPQYDVASLLEDPYVDLAETEKNELVEYCISISGASDFLQVYDYCVIQRLMQALGAYAFLGLKKGKPDFLRHIPNGVKHLTAVLNRQQNLSAIKTLLSGIKMS